MSALQPPSAGAEAATVVVRDDTTTIRLVGELELAEDVSGRRSLSEAMALPFEPATAKSTTFGFTSAAIWARFSLRSEALPGRSFVLETNEQADEIHFYWLRAGEVIKRVHTGDASKASTRDIVEAENYRFRLPLEPGPEHQGYVRWQSSRRLTVAALIHSEAALAERDRVRAPVMTLVYGPILVLCLFNLLLFGVLRRADYLFLAGYLLSYGLEQAVSDGFAKWLLWPETAGWMVRLGELFSPASALLAVAFSRSFLATRATQPGLDRLLLALAWCWVAVLVSSLVLPLSWAEAPQPWLILVTLAAGFVAGIRSLRRGNRPALFYVAGWAAPSIAVAIVLLLAAVGRLESVPMATMVPRLGVIGLGLLFSMALADQVIGLGEARRRALAEAERATQALERQNAELESFGYAISHDLRSPLVTLEGFLSALKKDLSVRDSKRVAEDFHHLETATRRLGQHIEEVGELSRTARRALHLEEVAFTDLVEEARGRVEASLRERGAELEIEGTLPVVSADRRGLVQVLQNLFENGIKFTPSHRRPRLTVGVREENDTPVFFVSDQGIGIDPSHHQRVFGLFTRLDPSTAGHGVGLALVRRIVRSHGGDVWVESDGHDQGTTVCMTLELPSEAAT